SDQVVAACCPRGRGSSLQRRAAAAVQRRGSRLPGRATRPVVVAEERWTLNGGAFARSSVPRTRRSVARPRNEALGRVALWDMTTGMIRRHYDFDARADHQRRAE